jgi:heptaprenyl diphosphate synthase
MTTYHPKTKYLSTKRIATLSVLTAMSLIMFMIESLFPPLIIPGAKMGISNIFSLLCLVMLSPVDAVICVVVRTTLGSVFTGNMSTLLYSMSAGLVSVVVSAILMEFVYPRVSVIAISVVSAVVHNITQNLVFCYISDTPEMMGYIAWLAVLGVIAGFIVGSAVYLIVRYVPTRTFAAILDWDRNGSPSDFAATNDAAINKAMDSEETK